MDPNALLDDLLLLISEANTASDKVAALNYRAISERFQALDEWIMKGGFLPTDWELSSRPALIHEKQKRKDA